MWQVCIWILYGTSLWQVADSKEQNGSYKIALTCAKKKDLKQNQISLDSSIDLKKSNSEFSLTSDITMPESM